MRTSFTSLVGIAHPLVGFSRSPGVVAAVSNAGGLGVLAATAYGPEDLDAHLRRIEEQVGDRPYGVDLLVPESVVTGDPGDPVASLRARIPAGHVEFVEGLLAKYGVPENVSGRSGAAEVAASVNPQGADALLDVVLAHRPALVANALGTPPPRMVEGAHSAGIPVAALIGSPRQAERQLAAGVDVLVAQGTEAGGHTGTIATMVLTPEVVDLAEGRPVLAAGGIADGRQMAAALALGAAGVWCGSVWLSSEEDVTPGPVKEKLLAASSSDTVRSRTRTGKPARQLRSAWHDEWEAEGSPAPLPLPLQSLLVNEAWDRIDAAAAAGHREAVELESFLVGQVVGAFTTLRPAAEIVRAIVSGCADRLRDLASAVD